MTNYKSENNETIHRIVTKKALKKLDMAKAMTNQQILEKSIQKAINGGWKFNGDAEIIRFNLPWDHPVHTTRTIGRNIHLELKTKHGNAGTAVFDYIAIIFNHDFAKALWGEDEVRYRDIYPHDEWNASELLHNCAWQYQLQQMVIADDPIKYLGDNL